MRKKTLLFIIKGSALNRGMNTGIENLAWGLAERGCDVHIMSGGTAPDNHDYSVPDNVVYHFTGKSGSPNTFNDHYHQLISAKYIDVVIGWIQNLAPLTFVEKESPKRHQPIFIANQGAPTRQGKSAHNTRNFLRRIKQAVSRLWHAYFDLITAAKFIFNPLIYYSKIDHVVLISSALQQNVRQVYGVDPKKCSIAYRGIDTNWFLPGKRVYTTGKKIQILYAGNVVKAKGVEDIVDAVKTLNHPIELIICGNATSTYISELYARLISASSKHTLHYLGPLSQKDLLLQYQKADLFLFCSLKEGLGKSLLEAMACGLPVIVSDILPFKEIIEDHINGLMVPVRSPYRIATGIQEYLENPELRERCGRNARETVLRRFSKENELDSWKRILNEYIVSDQQITL